MSSLAPTVTTYPQWVRLTNPPDFGSHGLITGWKNNQCLFIPAARSTNETQYIYRYNATSDQWDTLLKYPSSSGDFGAYIKVAADPQHDKVFLLNQRLGIFDANRPVEFLVCFLNETKSAQEISIKHESGFIQSDIICINGNMHCFNGSRDSGHVIWDGNMKNPVLKSLPDIPSQSIKQSPAVHYIGVPSKGIIVVIGRSGSGAYRAEPEGLTWKYDTRSRKWTKSELTLPHWPRNAELSPDENHIILSFRREIHVLDIENDGKWDLYQSKAVIRPEIRGSCRLIVLSGGHELLLIGWIREMFKTKEYQDLCLPPMYLLQMMAEWVSNEALHCFANGSHWAMDMKDILQR